MFNNDNHTSRPGGFRRNENSGEQRDFSQSSEGARFRPRFNNNNGYRGGYQQRPQGGYRPRFNNDSAEGGYQQRPQGGYRPRFNNNGEEGGYQQRPQGGYRPRFNNNGEEGGYQQRPQGGYRPRIQRNQNVYGHKKQMEYIRNYEDPTKPIRLNKYLANAGICSRREADDFIQAGVITVNGEVVSELGAKVLPTDKIMFHDQPVRRERKVYILLNKPKNTVTTSDDPEERRTVLDIVRNACNERIYPVGRLDRNTTGVLLLTNDGDLAAKLTHPKFNKKKIYAVTLDRELEPVDEAIIRQGVELDGEVIVPDALEFPKENKRKHLGLEIHSGQNRVVRRIFEKVGYKVTNLDRTSFAGLTKKNVGRGKWRFLTAKEVNMLQMGAFE